MTLWILLCTLPILTLAKNQFALALSCDSCQGEVDTGYMCPMENALYEVRTLPDAMVQPWSSSDAMVQIICPHSIQTLQAVRGCNFTNFTHFEFRGCPLPNTSFADVLNVMGVSPSSVTSLAFVSGNTEGNIQDTHLEGLHNLITLQLIDNELKYIPASLLASTPKLSYTRLVGNSLETLPASLFMSCPDLVMLDISNNSLKTLPVDIFADINKLTNISLFNNLISSLDPEHFIKVDSLKYVDLGNNMIANLKENQFKGMDQLRSLGLGGNRLKALPRGIFDDLRDLEELDLQDNLLETLPDSCFDFQKNLKELSIKNNSLIHLPNRLFEKCQSLIKLDLCCNKINFLDGNIFPNPSRLQYLNLGNNNITFDDDILSYSSPLENQLMLKEVYLDNNNIDHIPNHFNRLQLNLNTLDLSGNKITNIGIQSIFFPSDSVKLILKNNDITVIDLDKMDFISFQKKVVKLYIEGNPLTCFCKIYKLAKLSQTTSYETDSEKMQVFVEDPEKTFCIHPDTSTRELLSKVDITKLQCRLDKCLENCSCFWRPHDQMIAIDCSFAGIRDLPSGEGYYAFITTKFPISINFMNNSIASLEGLHHSFYDKVVNLSLANNKISHVNESDLPANLTSLDLSGNNLTRLTNSMVDHLIKSGMTLSLGRNPWVCDCDTLDLLSFLQVSYDKVLDQSRVTCPDDATPLYISTEHELCPFMKPMVIVTIVLIAVILLFFAVIGTFSFYKYKQGIKVWLFTHRMCLWAITEDEMDADKKYDAFISYSHKDEDFVNQVLVPGLESGEPRYRVCLHYRDWIPGEYIQNQILKSVEASRRTIVVLSPNFLESVWGQLEFKAAHSQALQDNTNRIIVVVYGEIPPTNDLDEQLKLYISMKTYVKWGDAKFWEKLRYIMPHPQELIQKRKKKKDVNIEL